MSLRVKSVSGWLEAIQSRASMAPVTSVSAASGSVSNTSTSGRAASGT